MSRVFVPIPISGIEEEKEQPSLTYKLDLDTGRIVDFYPRPPRGGRRLDGGNGFHDFLISIHALREEGDS